MRKITKVLLGLCTMTTLLGASFLFSGCDNDQFCVWADGYYLQEEEDGTYSILEFPEEALQSNVLEIPADIGGYPVKQIGAEHRVQDILSGARIQMPKTGKIRHLILPENITSIYDDGNSFGFVTVIETDNLLSEGNYRNDLYYKAPIEEGSEYTYLTEEDYEGSMYFYKCVDEERKEEYYSLLYAESMENLTPPETFHGLPVRLERGAFAGCEYQTVDLSGYEERLPSYLFSGAKVDTLLFSEETKMIDAFCFSNSQLKEITLPSGLQFVHKYLFAGSTIEKLTLPEGVTVIESGAFQNSTIGELYLPSTLSKLGEDVFDDCKGVKKLDLSHTQLADIMDFYMPDLEEVWVPKICASVKDNVFWGCNRLKKIHLYSADVQSLDGAFSDLEKIDLDENHPTLYTKDGFLYRRAEGGKDILIKAMGKLPVTKLTIDQEVAFYAFAGNQSLEEVEIIGAQEVKGGLFYRCESLQKVILGESIKTIRASAFSGCTNLKEINLGNVQTVGWSAFEKSGLEEVQSKSIESIDFRAFYECKELKKVVLPNCTDVERQALMGCEKLVRFECRTLKPGDECCKNTPIEDKDNYVTFWTWLQLKWEEFWKKD